MAAEMTAAAVAEEGDVIGVPVVLPPRVRLLMYCTEALLRLKGATPACVRQYGHCWDGH